MDSVIYGHRGYIGSELIKKLSSLSGSQDASRSNHKSLEGNLEHEYLRFPSNSTNHVLYLRRPEAPSNKSALNHAIQYANSKSAPFLYLSSSSVFSGREKFVKSLMAKDPSDEYGHMKATEEDYISSYSCNWTTLRLTKVVSEHCQLYKSWNDELKTTGKVFAATDYFLAPIQLDTVIGLILKWMQDPVPGIFQLSGQEEVSYFDHAVQRYGIDNVTPVQIRDEHFARGPHSSLQNSLPVSWMRENYSGSSKIEL